MGFLETMIKESGNEYASVVANGVLAGDISGYIGTGSYALNAALSGSLGYKNNTGGLSGNKITAFAGEEATGKSYFTLGVLKYFLDTDPENKVLFFETESALSKSIFTSRGIDPKRVGIFPVATVQEFATQAVRMVNNYLALDDKKRPRIMFALDSLGMLSTTKELTDITEGKGTKDMTRAQLVKGAFRVLTLKLGISQAPMIVTNHTYDVVGAYMPTKEMGGGGGLKYAASTIAFLGKKMLKDEEKGTGNIITVTLKKSRQTREGTRVEVKLTHNQGLDPWYGLVDVGIRAGVFQKDSTKVVLPGGEKAFEKTIYKNPTKFFTDDVMAQLEVGVQKLFLYGGSGSESPSLEVEDEAEETE